ncbi:MAG TPA: protein TolA [Bradyrhizobium sp.]|nr:protein TolA [Bradyrhizobium sp.]
MTAKDLIRKLRERKGTALSITLHVLVIGWGLISFSARSLEAPPPEDIIPVDISMDDTSKMTAGIKSGQKENPKPLVDKVGEAKPVDDAVGKVDKKDVVTDTSTPDPPPKPVEKPVEKKPDPKPQPKMAESKQADKKPDEKGDDPIADALKADKKKPVPKQAAKATPQPPKPKERIFDESRIAALLDKRDPSRQAVTGAVINPNAALGTKIGNANAMVATWKGAFVGAVRRCFNFPYNGQDADQFEVDIDIRLRPDGTVASEPVIVAVRGPSRSVGNALAESAKRAVEECQAYAFLPKDQYATWKYIPMTFGLKDLL